MLGKVFISWSSDDPRVQKTAENFKNWLLPVFGGRIAFFYSNDIDPGAHSLDEINWQIDSAKFAFFFLSRRTAKSSWVLFEAGCLRRIIDKGNAYFLLTDISVDEFRRLCPPLANYQASKLDSVDAVRAIVRNIGEKLEISNTEMLDINARAESGYAILEKTQKETLETIQLLPDAYTGLLPYGDTIECSTNFRMPRVFDEFQRELFLVGINMNFLLNLKANSANFAAMLKALMDNPGKRVNICICDIWEERHAYCYNRIVFGYGSVEMEGLTEVFKNENSDLYIDTFIKKTAGDKYDQITRQLTIKTIEMLGDTFWFVDADNTENSGNMMLIPMTSPAGQERVVFFANQRKQPNVFNSYHNLCRAGFNNFSKALWPERHSPTSGDKQF